ncbi:hydantoinase/oxoprolinase family protein [Emcibacter sp.]|uniref:hydantoinase/oxoprolinase family protein n=1 Tax=Emcibacter sp. TaxID=1979954 RepID=UPI002AA7EA78|nr:hydantoinase/oxoprolinase family protein [Emcibacter sp.]
MGYTIDIDTGGTFTDGFLVRDGDAKTVKVPTTPHDLTICFLECISAGADAYGVSTEDLLHETDIIRFSNTIGTNSIIQRDGAKIGLIVTGGMEALAPTADGDGKSPLVDPDMVLCLDEETDSGGNVTKAPEEDQILAAAQTLIDRGARGLVVSFANSERNPANEQLVRKVIKREYPRDYLGSVSVFLSSDISTRTGKAERLNSAVLNAYIHSKLARLLYKAGEDLRQRGYRKTLFIGHNNASVARVAKTRAINTYNSGPAAGLLGAREIGALYGIGNLISTDMGGTSFDIGYVKDGQASYALEPDVEGFPCNLPMMSILALGTGGGSIAHIRDGELKVGPQSAGALPGPACFNLGGSKPTVTDANLILGVLDPDFFLGGSMKLDMGKARDVVARDVAEPLGISVEEAAWRIKQTVDREMGSTISKVAKNFDQGVEPVVVAYGGAGGLHACDIGAASSVKKIIMTPFSAVSSAYSSSLMDAGHLYYRRAGVRLARNQASETLEQAVASMWAEAVKDMRGEGFQEEELGSELQLFVRSAGSDREAMITVETDFHKDVSEFDRAVSQAVRALQDMGETVTSDLELTTLALMVQARVPHYHLPELAEGNADISSAVKARRKLYSGRAGDYVDCPIYERDKLGRDVVIAGPGLVESSKTTILVPEGWKMTVDKYNNAILEEV